jgi:splicing factor 3B subunit 3
MHPSPSGAPDRHQAPALTAPQEGGGLQGVEFDEELSALEEQFGAPKGGEVQWASCLRIIEPQQLSTK